MAFGRRSPAVGTALDREELEELLTRITTATDELKATMFELGTTTRRAEKVVTDLNKAVNRADGSARRRMGRG